MEIVLKIIKKVINIIVDIAFILVLGYFIIFIPKVVSYEPLCVKEVNSSNIPFKEGALVYYKKVKIEELHKKDVILYEEGEKNYQTYVVTNIDDGKIYIDEDNYYKVKEITGKVAPVYIPYYGKYISFMMEHQLLLYILCGLVVVDFIVGSVLNSFKSTYRKSRITS